MLSWLANAWRVPELRRRLLFTAAILSAYRLGSWMPAPGVDSAQIQNFFNGRGGAPLRPLHPLFGAPPSRLSVFSPRGIACAPPPVILPPLTPVLPAAPHP